MNLQPDESDYVKHCNNSSSMSSGLLFKDALYKQEQPLQSNTTLRFFAPSRGTTLIKPFTQSQLPSETDASWDIRGYLSKYGSTTIPLHQIFHSTPL
jgi:hypothetical protein